MDSHAHLNDSRYKDDLPDVIERAVAAGVTGIIVAGYDLSSSRRALNIAAEYKNCWATAGVHPHDAGRVGSKYLHQLEKLLIHEKVVAVGEIGLDYHYNYSAKETQQKVFREQLQLALEYKKPVVIHDREAHQDTWQILSSVSCKISGVMHCFSGSWEFARQCMDIGLSLGFDGPLTFENARKGLEIVAKMPREYLLLETDCPYLTPHPHRGKRNEPSYLPLIAAKVAEIWGITVEEVGRITSDNTRRLFKITQSEVK